MIFINIRDFVDSIFSKKDITIDLLEEIINYLKKEGKSELEALEECDRLNKRVKRAIKKKIEDSLHHGITPTYSFDSVDDDRLIRTDLIVDVNEEREIKKVIETRKLIEEFLKQVTWQDFEKICALILRINGIEKCKVTRGSKDGGVDVYGWLKCDNDKRISHDIYLRVLGQGKHRSSGGEVSNADISEFVTDIDKLRKKQGFSLFVLPDEFINSPFPLIAVLITNGYYREDAKITAMDYGIVIWDGEQICEDIAKYFDLSPFLSNGVIDKEKFIRYLDSLD